MLDLPTRSEPVNPAMWPWRTDSGPCGHRQHWREPAVCPELWVCTCGWSSATCGAGVLRPPLREETEAQDWPDLHSRGKTAQVCTAPVTGMLWSAVHADVEGHRRAQVGAERTCMGEPEAPQGPWSLLQPLPWETKPQPPTGVQSTCPAGKFQRPWRRH